MEYGITEKLKEKSKLAYLRDAAEKNLLLCWEAGVVTKDGQDVLLIVNAATRYCTVLTGLEEVEWLDLRRTVEKGVKAAIRGAGIPDLFINTYYENAGDADVTVTHGEEALEGFRYIAQTIESSRQPGGRYGPVLPLQGGIAVQGRQQRRQSRGYPACSSFFHRESPPEVHHTTGGPSKGK